FDVTQRNGWRWNAAKAFLKPAKKRDKLHIWTQAHVETLLLDDNRTCTGVKVLRKGKSVVVKASRETVLCAGAINTPKILLMSGVGNGEHLKSVGVSPKHVLPGVGQNLQDHLQIRSVFKIDNVPTLNTLANSWFGKAKIAAEYAIKRSGPMSMAPSQLGAFTKSDPSRHYANLEYHVQPLSLDAFGQPLHTFPAMTASVCNLNPTSRGQVSLNSRNPEDAPKIEPNYLDTEEDRKVAAQSLRQVRDIMAQPAMKPYNPVEWKPGAEFQTDDELAKLAGDIATTIFHPVGTAKMGTADDPMAVVDPKLRVHGVKKLRVVDASIMPTITSGNTNAPVMMIAEKAARWILAGE
ncbi:MAG: GMC family oxidoreductase, partial [Alphaproteobacteria bacterium]